MEQGGGQVEAPLHSSTESFNLVLSTIGKTDQGESFADRLLHFCAGEGVERGEKSQIVPGREFVVERHVLGDESDLQLDRVGVARDRAALDQNFAGIRAHQTGNDGDGCGFPRPVGPEQANGLSLSDAKGDSVDRGQLSVALDKTLNLKHGCGV